jgi:hypothetical protein
MTSARQHGVGRLSYSTVKGLPEKQPLKDLRDVERIGKKVVTRIAPFLQFEFHPIP